jgi:sugar phosphate isomerase/epimerase
VKLGFMTGCMAGSSFSEIAVWASEHGYSSLEVASWPAAESGEFTAAHIDSEQLDADTAAEVLAVSREHGIEICSLAYYANNLHHDRSERERVNAHVRRCIDAASLLGVPTVGTFIGRDFTRTIPENLKLARRTFAPLAAYAQDRGVKLLFENAVVEHWHPDLHAGNLGYSPELWEELFEFGLYLNFDPSHLVYLGIDPLVALDNAFERVALVQAKDIQTFPERRNRWGWPGRLLPRTEPFDSGWWRFRIPGLGEINWSPLVDRLAELGYDGTISVEHEDPVWGGSSDLTRKGLAIAERHLSALIN